MKKLKNHRVTEAEHPTVEKYLRTLMAKKLHGALLVPQKSRKFDEEKQVEKLVINNIIQDEDEVFEETFYNEFADESVNYSRQCNMKTIYKYSNTDVMLLLSTINRIAWFYERNYKNIIVDGLMGLRAAEGTLKNVLNLLNSKHKLYFTINIP